MTVLGSNPRATVSPSEPEAFAICDRCSAVYNHKDLQWQYAWRGNQLTNLRLLVCRNCLDVPFENNRPIALPPDPKPIQNPRPPFWAQQEGAPPPDEPVWRLLFPDPVPGPSSQGVAEGEFEPLTGNALGSMIIEGDAAGTFEPLAGAGAGFTGFVSSGPAAGTFQALTGDAAGFLTANGVGNGTFAGLTGNAAGNQTMNGIGAGTFQALTGSAIGTSDAVNSFWQAITDAGLEVNCVAAFDAADSNCYSGSGSTVNDLAGAPVWTGGTNFTFVGTPGSLASDTYFTGVAGTGALNNNAGTWSKSFHKASQVWTVLFIAQKLTGSTVQFLTGSGGAQRPWVQVQAYQTDIARYTVSNDTTAATANGPTGIPQNQWFFMAASISTSGGANASRFVLNNTNLTFDANVIAPSTADSPSFPRVLFEENCRLACFAAFNTNLSQSQIAAIKDALNGRFGF